MGVKKIKKTDLGDMVWVKYGITEYCAFLVTSNDPEHITDEETGALMVQVEWNGWSNTREWVFVHDILHKSSIELIGEGAAGEIGRGRRSKRTPQEAMAQKDEEMASWLAVHSRQPPPAPSALKRLALKSAQENEQDEEEEEYEEEEADDNIIDLCSSSSSSSSSGAGESCESSEEEEEDDDEFGYWYDWDEQAPRQKPILAPVQPYGLYDPRFEFMADESSSESEDDDDDDDDDDDAASNQENYDCYENNDFMGSNSESEVEEDEDAAGKRIIVEKSTEVFRNSPPDVKLQTLVDSVHKAVGNDIRTRRVDFFATVAQHMDFLKMTQQRSRGGGGGGAQQPRVLGERRRRESSNYQIKHENESGIAFNVM